MARTDQVIVIRGCQSSTEAPPTDVNKRLFSSSVGAHDALIRIHAGKTEDCAKRRKADAQLQQEQLELQRQQLRVQLEEIRLREKKMDQQFLLMCKQLDIERECLEMKKRRKDT